MGLFKKRNPRSTRQSVVWWAIGGGVAGAIVAVTQSEDMNSSAYFFFVPWMSIVGAIAFGAMEWLTPPGTDC